MSWVNPRSCLLALLVAASGFVSADTMTGRVVGVVDGDTVDILTADREQVRIRLAGIDAPEKAQPYGQRSKQKMSDLVFDKNAEVDFTKRDRYGRIIGKVMVNGRDASLGLLDAGLAWHYKKYAGEQSASDRAAYANAEDAARSAKVGLWGGELPTAPWDWRRGNR